MTLSSPKQTSLPLPISPIPALIIPKDHSRDQALQLQPINTLQIVMQIVATHTRNSLITLVKAGNPSSISRTSLRVA